MLAIQNHHENIAMRLLEVSQPDLLIENDVKSVFVNGDN